MTKKYETYTIKNNNNKKPEVEECDWNSGRCGRNWEEHEVL